MQTFLLSDCVAVRSIWSINT